MLSRLQAQLRLASTKAFVTAPIQLYSLDGRYATALYTAAVKTSPATLDNVQTSMTTLSRALKQDSRILSFLSDPTQSKSDKKAIIQSLVARTFMADSGSHIKLLSNLLQTLAENGRLGLLERVIGSFSTIMSAHKKEIQVTMVSSKALEPSDRKQFIDRITKQFIPSGYTPVFQDQVDTSIMGGIIIHIADRTIDMSVSSRVNRINQELSKPI
jgi:F-type H+-transporting ATPase subunit O